MDILTPLFWTALLKIIGINIVLSGDNAIVIALAARSLPEHQQKKAIFWGSGAAIIMRIVLTIFAVALLQLPWLKIVGAGLLLWIGVNLMLPDDGGESVASHDSLGSAIKTILIADLVMSVDNVIAVAAAAKDNMTLLIIGLVISIPLIIFASTLLLKLMDRFPIIITIGAALLGFVAGEMAVTDPVAKEWVGANAHWLYTALPAAGIVIVVGLGTWLARRAEAKADLEPVVDLALQDQRADSSRGN